jgi:hypothetical protein
MLLNASIRSGRFDYAVVAQSPVRGKSLEELKGVRFWVGLGQDGTEMSLSEMVATWQCLAEMREIVEGRRFLWALAVDMNPSDDVMAEILTYIEIIE